MMRPTYMLYLAAWQRLRRDYRLPALLLPGLLLAGCSTMQEPEPADDIPLQPAEVNPLPGTSWVASSIMGQPADSALSTLTFTDDGRVTGNSGCNNFSGAVEADLDRVKFGMLASTRMMCEPAVSGQEIVFLDALSMVVSWQQAGSQLLLFDETGETVMQLARATD